MEPDYWLQRWHEGRTGWHHGTVMPLLEKHWPALGATPGSRVLVPLCGKSLDMLWLARQGLHVLGVDLAPTAVTAFLAENDLRAQSHAAPEGTRHEIQGLATGGIEIITGDIFDVPDEALAGCTAFYDRAALIALPVRMRERLVREAYAKLATGARGLLITLDYPQAQMQGPPFSVDDAEVHHLFDADWNVETLARRDILADQPSFVEQGVDALHTAVYRLEKRKP
jgi:thiopurine S-methyltransferase